MPKKKAISDKECRDRIKQALMVLDSVLSDYLTPRNIRESVKRAMGALKSGSSYAVRAADAISILDDISQDPNMPQHTRVKIWNVVSSLEGIRD